NCSDKRRRSSLAVSRAPLLRLDPPCSRAGRCSQKERSMDGSPSISSQKAHYGVSRLAWFLVFSMAAVLFLGRLASPLLEPEEARYAEIPRQMLAEGRVLVPALHGQPYLDKPPLLYWLVMASYSTIGVQDWAARLVPGSAGWLTVLLVWAWARR